MNYFRLGSYVWTAAAAGWLVLFLLTDEPLAALASLGCALCSFTWNWLLGD